MIVAILINPISFSLAVLLIAVTILTVAFRVGGFRFGRTALTLVIVGFLIGGLNAISGFSGGVCGSFMPPFHCHSGVFFN